MINIPDAVTPAIINKLNYRFIIYSRIAGEFQLPKILWIWMLVTVLSIPVAFFCDLDILSGNDKEIVLQFSVITGFIQIYLYAVILNQYRSVQSFAKTGLFYGIKEQLIYLFVTMLCCTNAIILPFIIDWRTSRAMTTDQIQKEREIFNRARHYFMSDQVDYHYFPDRKTLNAFSFKDHDKSKREEFYLNEIRPLLVPYFTEDTSFRKIDMVYTRNAGGPQLYYVGEDFADIFNIGAYYYNITYRKEEYPGKLNYQFIQKSDAQHLKDITEFIRLNERYQEYGLKSSYAFLEIKFEDPSEILARFKSNQFSPCVIIQNPHTTIPNSLSGDVINNAHFNIIDSGKNKWNNALAAFYICLFPAYMIALLFFIYKNVRFKEFILSLVYGALLILMIALLTVVTGDNGVIASLIPFVILFSGIFLILTLRFYRHFSSFKIFVVIFSNLIFPLIPFYFFLFNRGIRDFYSGYGFAAGYYIGGTLVIYLLIGSVIYKRAYEKIYALPFKGDY
jgi:hypothetical protein